MEMEEKVRAAVKEILAEADMGKTSQAMVRTMAAERAGVDDASAPWLKKLVKGLVQDYIQAEETKEEAKQQAKPIAEDEDHLICQLSAKRNVAVQNFRGKPLVSIREYYEKDGKSLPSSKGISLTVEQWEAFKKGIPDIQKAVAKLQ